jgi:hypothetical protein
MSTAEQMWNLSSKKSSVKRHIQNIHNGDGVFVSYIDYLAGRRSCLYLPSLPPTYEKKKQEKKKVDYLSILEKEAWRECVRNKVQHSLSCSSSSLEQKYQPNKILEQFFGAGLKT